MTDPVGLLLWKISNIVGLLILIALKKRPDALNAALCKVSFLKKSWKLPKLLIFTIFFFFLCFSLFVRSNILQRAGFFVALHSVHLDHWCIVVNSNVFQQQNIFFSRMNRSSEDSSRKIIPVQFWELLHRLKYFFLKYIYIYIYFFYFVAWFYHKKVSKEHRKKDPNLSYKFFYWFQRLTFENVHRGPIWRPLKFATSDTWSLVQSL